MHQTDKAWETWGTVDPYYGVLTSEPYRKADLSDASKKIFFDTGRDHFNHVLRTIRRHLDPTFSPTRGVDFGCGTGRVLVAIAGVCEEVLGLDIADSMLTECQINCHEAQLKNVTLEKSNDTLSALSGEYDLIHSFIVFQHIRPSRGKVIIPRLLDHLSQSGVAVLHIVYQWDAGMRQRIAYFMRHHVPLAHVVMKRFRNRHSDDPKMEMNVYNMNLLLGLLDKAGVEKIYIEPVRHGAHRGAILYASKKAGDPL